MIWYEKELLVKEQPEKCEIWLRGGYKPPGIGDPLITIYLSIDNLVADSIIGTTLFTHNPSMMRQEDPSRDDVLAKYNHKIVKYCGLITKMTYQELMEWVNDKNRV
jgi:hypothetical protein